MKETRKDKAAEDKKRTADRPGPKDRHEGTTDTRPATHSVTARLPPCKNCGCGWAKITKVSDGVVTDVERVVYTKTRMKHVEGSCYACGNHIEGKFWTKDVKEYGDGSNAADGDGSVVLIKRLGNEKFGMGDVVRSTGGDGGQAQVARTEDGGSEEGDVVECTDLDGDELLDVPEGGTALSKKLKLPAMPTDRTAPARDRKAYGSSILMAGMNKKTEGQR